jgi:hypothetical protein
MQRVDAWLALQTGPLETAAVSHSEFANERRAGSCPCERVLLRPNGSSALREKVSRPAVAHSASATASRREWALGVKA